MIFPSQPRSSRSAVFRIPTRVRQDTQFHLDNIKEGTLIEVSNVTRDREGRMIGNPRREAKVLGAIGP